jgi:L-cystine transport system substrate-binding protein
MNTKTQKEFYMKTKRLVFFLVILSLLAVLAGCAKKQENTGAAGEARENIIIRAVTETAYPPYSYVDDNNVLTGYDVEVVRAIGDRLRGQGYEIQVEGLPAEAAYMALQSHTTDIFFDEMAITPDREERYHFSIPYYVVSSNIIVKKGRTDIKSMKDLEGKRVGSYTGDVWDVFMVEYNENTAEVPIELTPVDGTIEQVLLNLQNGLYEAVINNPVTAAEIISRNKLDLEIVLEPVMGENIGLIFSKDEDGLKLKNLIDPVIAELERDGTLTRLSKQFTGYEYIP